MTETNYHGALEHIALNVSQWAQRIIRAQKLHQEDADTKKNSGEHGLTEEEMNYQEARP